MKADILTYDGHEHLRHRLVLALLAGKTIRFRNIRVDDDHVGLAEFEISFLNMLEKVTNGTVVEISYTGTGLLFKPGVITGGRIEHDCGTERSIGYFLQPLMLIAPFAKVVIHCAVSWVFFWQQPPCTTTHQHI